MKFNKIRWGTAVVLSAVLALSAIPNFALSAKAADPDSSGNSMLSPDEFTMGKVVTGTIDEYIENDWYTFTIAEPSKINFSLAVTESILKTDFVLIDGDDDNAEIYKMSETLSSFNKTFYLSSGTYYIGFNRYQGGLYRGGDYEFKVTATPCSLNIGGRAENNTMTKAAAVEFDKKYSAQISQNDAIDYYTFDLPNDAGVYFDFLTGMDVADWALYDNENDLIKHGSYKKDNANDTELSKRNYLVLKAGKYTLSVAKNDANESYGPYTFSLEAFENYNDLTANGIIAFGDLDHNGTVDASDASLVLQYYAYLSTGGTELDMNKWLGF